jgi:putative protease
MKKKKKHKKQRVRKKRDGHAGRPTGKPEKSQPELLAPAGSKDGFFAAIENGADAVYFGIGTMNARAYGKNFSTTEAVALTEEAHSNQVKAFAAINTLLQEKELPAAIETVSILYQAGIDALIIQDVGLWHVCKRYFPDMRLHASTLMTVHNSAGVRQARNMGYKRVVLAREMTLPEIRSAARTRDIETEIFIHGALCFTYSGLCMFSSFYGGRSSTRGRCVQPCRRRFRWNGREGSFFSMTDLDTLSLIPDLRNSGVSSFKIEGRLKPAGYTASVVRAYRMVMDAEEHEVEEAIAEGKKILASAMGRESSSGFFLSPAPGEILAPYRAANTGQYIGKVTGLKETTLLLKAKLAPFQGDRLRYVIPSLDTQFPFTCKTAVRRDDGRYEIGVDANVREKLVDLERKRISGKNRGKKSEALVFRTDNRNYNITHNRTLPEISSSFITRLMKKARESGKFIIREEGLIRHTPAGTNDANLQNLKKQGGQKNIEPEIWLKTDRLKHLEFASRIRHKGIIVEINRHNTAKMRDRKIRHMGNIVWSIPVIVHEAEMRKTVSLLKELLNMGQRAFMLGNMAHFDMLRQAISGKNRNLSRLELYGGRELNILNSLSLKAFSELGIRYPQISTETGLDNAKIIRPGGKKTFFTVMAWIPLFTSRARHHTFHTGKSVTSMRGEEYCWHQKGGTGYLLPSRPFSLLNRRKKLAEAGFKAWILDLSLWPPHIKAPAHKPGTINSLARTVPGQDFNFSNGLD